MSPKDTDGMANSVDPDQTALWVCTVCPDLPVRKLRNISRSTLYAHAYLSENIGSLPYAYV